MNQAKTKRVHKWMKSLNDDEKMRFAINWRLPHSLFNVACKIYKGGGDALQDVNWFKIYKSGNLGRWSNGNKVNVLPGVR